MRQPNALSVGAPALRRENSAQSAIRKSVRRLAQIDELKEVVMLSELLRVIKQHNMELLEVDFRRGKARAKFAGAEVGLRFDRETFQWSIESRLAFALAG
jgi:hypothetical protein